jgi:HAMP domain-containing protein
MGENDTKSSTTLTTARVRSTVARVVWLVCLALAMILAVAAFSYALEFEGSNPLVRLVRDLADTFDLGVFDLDNPIKSFNDDDASVAQTKTALTNYGIGAVAYIVVGRVLERIIRP